MAFSPEGKRLATTSEYGTVQVYAFDPRELTQPGLQARHLPLHYRGVPTLPPVLDLPALA